jgi:hypothetical protein
MENGIGLMRESDCLKQYVFNFLILVFDIYFKLMLLMLCTCRSEGVLPFLNLENCNPIKECSQRAL